jgi:hypothetical protein
MPLKKSNKKLNKRSLIGGLLIALSFIAAIYFNQKSGDFVLPEIKDQQATVIPVQPAPGQQQILKAAEQSLSNNKYIFPESMTIVLQKPGKQLVCQNNNGCVVILSKQKRILAIPEKKDKLLTAKQIFNNPPSKSRQ